VLHPGVTAPFSVVKSSALGDARPAAAIDAPALCSPAVAIEVADVVWQLLVDPKHNEEIPRIDRTTKPNFFPQLDGQRAADLKVRKHIFDLAKVHIVTCLVPRQGLILASGLSQVKPFLRLARIS
jgi:hypothetical protein